MKKINLLLLIGLALGLSSCEKAFFDEDLASTNPYDNFDYLWDQCDKKYAYFDLKQVDWDAVKIDYRSKLFKGMTEDSLFNVLGGMLTELKDDHTNLISDFNVSSYGVRYDEQDNFDWRIIVDNYITQDYYSSGPFSHNFLQGTNKEIAYVRLPAFTGTVSKKNLDFILERYQFTKGLILDLRENGGGAVSDVFKILSRFVETETLTNYSRIKDGPGHNDFSDIEPVYVSPYNGIRYSKKVAVLVDRSSFSATSFTALATKALPNMILIGQSATGGGLGLPNGGQLPNGWTYRFSVTQALTLDKKPDYENGVPVDVTAQFDWNDLTTDEIIEAAVVEINK